MARYRIWAVDLQSVHTVQAAGKRLSMCAVGTSRIDNRKLK